MIFFTSDTHFWHGGIIKMCRPWARDVDDMNLQLVQAWHDAGIEAGDTVYHLGDLSFAGVEKTLGVMGRLPRCRIKLVPGNHDDPKLLNRLVDAGFIEVLPPLYTLKVDIHRFVLCHFALASWDRMHYGAMQLHGHSHGNMFEGDAKRTDVGVDAHGQIRPVPMDTIVERLKARKGEFVDHHRPD